MKISELMIHLQEAYKDFGDIEVRASIYDSDWDARVEDEITNSEVEGYTKTTDYIENLLGQGYVVVNVTPFIKNGNTEYVEYILEKDV